MPEEHPEASMGAHPSATERYNAERALLQADEAALRAMQGQLDTGIRIDETRFVALQSAIAHSRERLPTLHAMARQERAAIDVTGLVEAWQPLMESKQAAYDVLSTLVRQVWDQVAAIETIHGEQEALLQALPDDEVRRVMMQTFWIDVVTMRVRMAGNMYPPAAWHDFLMNAVGYRTGSGSAIAANDPGCTPIPPALISKIVEGQLWLGREHRSRHE